MTYGPPNQGGYYPAGQQPGYPQPAPASGIGAKLTAATSTKATPLTIIGALFAVLGLLVVIFSIVGPWQTMKVELVKASSSDETVGDYYRVDVTGLKSVDATCSLEADDSTETKACQDGLHDSIKGDFVPEGSDDERPILASAAGGWTLGFGIAAVLASLPLLFRRYQGIGALAGNALALAAAICAIVFAATKGAGVVDADYPDAWNRPWEGNEYVESSAGLGWGLIIVLVASILMLLTAIAAIVLVAQGRPGVAALVPGYGQPVGYGQYGASGGQYAGHNPAQSGPQYGQPSVQYGSQAPGSPQPMQYGQTQLNPNAGGGAPQQYGPQPSGPQPSGPQPGQPAQWGQTQYNQYPGQGGNPQ